MPRNLFFSNPLVVVSSSLEGGRRTASWRRVLAIFGQIWERRKSKLVVHRFRKCLLFLRENWNAKLSYIPCKFVCNKNNF